MCFLFVTLTIIIVGIKLHAFVYNRVTLRETYKQEQTTVKILATNVVPVNQVGKDIRTQAVD